MKKLQISLKPGERIYVNGAVLKVDRKVSVEFLNDVSFLLEHHVLHPEDTRTPLRQLYFIVQTVLIDPANSDDARAMFYVSLASILGCVGLALGAWLFGYTPMYAVAAACAAGLIVWRHHENVKRLLSGTERRLGERATTG